MCYWCSGSTKRDGTWSGTIYLLSLHPSVQPMRSQASGTGRPLTGGLPVNVSRVQTQHAIPNIEELAGSSSSQQLVGTTLSATTCFSRSRSRRRTHKFVASSLSLQLQPCSAIRWDWSIFASKLAYYHSFSFFVLWVRTVY